MYPNLKAEMARIGITAMELAEKIKMPYSTLVPKLNGRYDFTLTEAKQIKETLKIDMPIELLFMKAA